MVRIKKKQSTNIQDNQTIIPSDDRILSLCQLLEAKNQQEITHRRYAPVKHVLSMVGLAGVIGMTIVSPGGVAVGKLVLDSMREKEFKERKKYNPYYLHRSIRRLHEQKFVDIHNNGQTQIITLTKMGKRRILKYALDELTISTPKHWDGRWRMIIYDVDERKKKLRDVFRSALKSLGFYKLQGSIWIYPYPCENQISFLREYYGVGNEVLYVVAVTLEDDTPYREYFMVS